MEKEFVTYEIAVKLKELGFNEPCFANYSVLLKDPDWHTGQTEKDIGVAKFHLVNSPERNLNSNDWNQNYRNTEHLLYEPTI